MLFCVSLCDEDRRVILDDDPHGETLAVIEAANWVEARGLVLQLKEMNPFSYWAGWGWYRRELRS